MLQRPEPVIPLDRRAAPRHAVTVPIRTEMGTGTTRNVSATGVLFEIGGVGMRLGTALDFWLRLSTVSNRLRCRGRVVRVEPGLHGFAVATTIDACWFECHSDMK